MYKYSQLAPPYLWHQLESHGGAVQVNVVAAACVHPRSTCTSSWFTSISAGLCTCRSAIARLYVSLGMPPRRREVQAYTRNQG